MVNFSKPVAYAQSGPMIKGEAAENSLFPRLLPMCHSAVICRSKRARNYFLIR
jgi:hypothetical protein